MGVCGAAHSLAKIGIPEADRLVVLTATFAGVQQEMNGRVRTPAQRLAFLPSGVAVRQSFHKLYLSPCQLLACLGNLGTYNWRLTMPGGIVSWKASRLRLRIGYCMSLGLPAEESTAHSMQV